MQPTAKATSSGFCEFQSSPVPEDGCNLRRTAKRMGLISFNPHPSRRTGATRKRSIKASISRCVSILTRPGGRVQLENSNPNGYLLEVSILTRPGGRVQHFIICGWGGIAVFQSSPVPEDGCNG